MIQEQVPAVVREDKVERARVIALGVYALSAQYIHHLFDVIKYGMGSLVKDGQLFFPGSSGDRAILRASNDGGEFCTKLPAG